MGEQDYTHRSGWMWGRLIPALTSPRAEGHGRVLPNWSSTCLPTLVFAHSCTAPLASRMGSMLPHPDTQIPCLGPTPPCCCYRQSHPMLFTLLVSQSSPQLSMLSCSKTSVPFSPAFPVRCHLIETLPVFSSVCLQSTWYICFHDRVSKREASWCISTSQAGLVSDVLPPSLVPTTSALHIFWKEKTRWLKDMPLSIGSSANLL